jgi:transcription factor MYB, plant
LNANLKDQSHLNWQEPRNESSPVAGLLNANFEEQSHPNWQEPRNETSPEAGYLNANLEEQSHLNWHLQEPESWTDGDKCFDQWFDPCHKPDFPGS